MEEQSKRGLRISDLNDYIVQDIISILPIKEAVRTSVLSKKWEHLWKSISKLDLDEEAHENREQFKDFIENILLVFNTSGIRKFSLSFQVGEDVAQVNKWLSRVVNPNIEEVTLDLGKPEQQLFFHEHIFISRTLTKLKLSMHHVIEFPSSIQFRSLKILSMEHVIFPDTSSTQFFFSSSCPSLEELTLANCNWINVIEVIISCPLLQKLVIEEWEDNDEDDENNDPGGCKIVINGTNITSFSYGGNLINDYSLSHSTSSVTDVCIMVYREGDNWETGYFVLKLLTALANTVEKLKISDYAFEGVYLPKDCENYIFPLPCCFGTYLKTIKIYYFYGTEAELNAIKFLLQEASVLETLYVYIDEEHDYDSPTGEDMLEEIYDQIMQYPRASKDCELELE
ncbi:putative F-box domain, FBD domain, leucine-rich repeat domain, L domain-containing protein [Lupinus albus]|uniref:Putative F-box domain, FBD domain, leucine-rich repeat domain, L domain-containing protein n=1 Tax=Lupinus albus TaxID=3870 RepID=A0A6A4PXZ6_LUPAL|nr:putative F-box domain, FBD domain, leucine-rich repeat domain, L domain-containing protein [Lupinus albus]